jgi:hypothetical protein
VGSRLLTSAATEGDVTTVSAHLKDRVFAGLEPINTVEFTFSLGMFLGGLKEKTGSGME